MLLCGPSKIKSNPYHFFIYNIAFVEKIQIFLCDFGRHLRISSLIQGSSQALSVPARPFLFLSFSFLRPGASFCDCTCDTIHCMLMSLFVHACMCCMYVTTLFIYMSVFLERLHEPSKQWWGPGDCSVCSVSQLCLVNICSIVLKILDQNFRLFSS